MDRFIRLAFLAVAVGLLAPSARAQDDADTSSGDPAAGPNATITGGGASMDEGGIDIGKADAAPSTGKSASGTGGAGGVGSPSGGGKSCAESEPKLTNVYRKEIHFYDKTHRGNVIRFALAPNEAISYRLKTPRAGTAIIKTEEGPPGVGVPVMTSISETPCDFDITKLEKTLGGDNAGQNNCYSWGMMAAGGVVFTVAPGKSPGCVLKPDTVYYFNIRFLSDPRRGGPRDSCEERATYLHGAKVRCGGIWGANGAGLKWDDELAQAKSAVNGINDSANQITP